MLSTVMLCGAIGVLGMVLGTAVSRDQKRVSAYVPSNRSLAYNSIIQLSAISPIHIVKKRLRAWAYLFDGPNIIRHAFYQVRRSTWLTSSNTHTPAVTWPAIRSRCSRYTHGVCIIAETHQRARQHFRCNSVAQRRSETRMSSSLGLGCKCLKFSQMLQPLYTMNGFNWFDKRGVEGVGFVRTLRTLLTNNLSQILPDLGMLTRTRWASLLSEQRMVDGTTHAAIYPMMMNMVVLLNARSLFGEDLSMAWCSSYDGR